MVTVCLVPALALLFFYVSTFRSMCAVPNMAVFCSSLTSLFPGMSLTYFLNDDDDNNNNNNYYYYPNCILVSIIIYTFKINDFEFKPSLSYKQDAEMRTAPINITSFNSKTAA